MKWIVAGRDAMGRGMRRRITAPTAEAACAAKHRLVEIQSVEEYHEPAPYVPPPPVPDAPGTYSIYAGRPYYPEDDRGFVPDFVLLPGTVPSSVVAGLLKSIISKAPQPAIAEELLQQVLHGPDHLDFNQAVKLLNRPFEEPDVFNSALIGSAASVFELIESAELARINGYNVRFISLQPGTYYMYCSAYLVPGEAKRVDLATESVTVRF